MMKYFHRQIQLFGEEVQKSLQNKSVAIIGSGGLGSTLSLALGATGIGSVHVVDFDEVSIHNIHRQILFKTADERSNKASIAKKVIEDRCPYVKAYAHECNFAEFSKKGVEVDLVLDATDNLPSRKDIDTYCKEVDTPWVYASVEEFNGQVCFFKDAVFDSVFKVIKKQPAGIAAPIVMHIGSLQANLAFRYLANMSVKKDTLYYLSFDEDGELFSKKFSLPK